MRALLIICCVALAGCSAQYEKKLASWVGSPVGALVSSWGPPQSSYRMQDGSEVLEYHNQGSMQIGGGTYSTPQTTYHQGTTSAYGNRGYASGSYSGTSTTYVQQQMPSTQIQLRCTTRFVVDSYGIIQNWSWQGNNCR